MVSPRVRALDLRVRWECVVLSDAGHDFSSLIRGWGSAGRGGRGGRAQCVGLGRLLVASGGVCRQQAQGHEGTGDRYAGGDQTGDLEAVEEGRRRGVVEGGRQIAVATGSELVGRAECSADRALGGVGGGAGKTDTEAV